MSLDIFTNFATDEVAENSGVWRNIGGGASLLIARNGNRRYSDLITRRVAEHRETLDLKNDVANAKSDEILADVIGGTILLGWKGVAYKGKDLGYSVENARMLLKHKDFRGLVIRLSEEVDAYRAKLEDDQGNG